MTGVPREHIRVSKVVGENEEGLTLFVPKNENGVFNLTDGDAFLTILFVHQVEGVMETWLPWEDD